MFKKFLAVTVILSVVGMAGAAITAAYGDNGFGGWDITITTTDGSDWTVAGLHLASTGTYAFAPFDPPFSPYDGSADEYQTFMTHPGGFPNTTAFVPTTFAPGSPNETASTIDDEWYDTLSTYPDGTYVLARIAGDEIGTGYFEYGSGGVLYTLDIPEPASLALLALGGLALIRRR